MQGPVGVTSVVEQTLMWRRFCRPAPCPVLGQSGLLAAVLLTPPAESWIRSCPTLLLLSIAGNSPYFFPHQLKKLLFFPASLGELALR
jgi:hypothetical protein